MTTTHRLVIFNRAPLSSVNGWIHIVPKGELPNKEAGITQVLDDESMDSILAGIEKDKNRLGDKWPGVYAGREHFIYDPDKDSAALAWFKDFQKRDDGIWAKDDGLTPAGSSAVQNREYKFTSFVADPADLKKVSGEKYRVLKIETVGFTNYANGRELLTPIVNRNNFDDSVESSDSNQNPPPPGFGAAGQPESKKMKTVCTLLGLSADADESSVHAAVTKLQNRGDATPGELTTLRNRADITPDALKTLREENIRLLDEQIEADFAAAGITDEKILNRHRPLLADPKHFKDRAERVEFIKDLGKAGGKTDAQTKLYNRGAIPPGGKGGTREKTEVTPSQLQAEVRKIMNRDGIKDYTTAFNQLAGERPELFA